MTDICHINHLQSSHVSPFLSSETHRKYEDNCDSLHEESISETAENSGEEGGEGPLEVEAGEMTDGGEEDYDEEGSTDLVHHLHPPPHPHCSTGALLKLILQIYS